MESSILDYLRNDRWTHCIHVSAEFIGGGLVSSWWLCCMGLLAITFQKVSLGLLELRTQVSCVHRQTQLSTELSPSF